MKKTIVIAIFSMVSANAFAAALPAKPEPTLNCKDWSYERAAQAWVSGPNATIKVGECTRTWDEVVFGKHTVKACGKYDVTDMLDSKCGAKHK